jgi:exopolysaccharide biosynthesis protein
LPFDKAKFWDVRDAFHAGVQPRSAIGYTKNNELILMVIDGRQPESRGVYLEELALMMNEFNCIEALNLDGGGSSAMVADSRLLNRPGGRTYQREVMSAVGIFYHQ